MATRTELLPDTTGLGPVHLQVADLERSVRYYGEVLGFRVLNRGDGEAILAAHGDDAPLVRLRERPGAVPVPRRGQLGLYHYAILLPDRPALGRLVVHLSDLGVKVGASDHRVSEALYLTDPDGLGIEVYADRPRAEWEWGDGELVMATDPLDLEAIVATARGERWSGMPAGTRIGHVHLHVGAIPEAAAFYQEALGLEPTVRSYPGALFLSAGGYHHHVAVNTWAGPAAAPAGAGDAQLLEWSLVVPTPEQAAAAARRVRGAGFGGEEVEGGWLLTDPWGTEVRVVGAGEPDSVRSQQSHL